MAFVSYDQLMIDISEMSVDGIESQNQHKFQPTQVSDGMYPMMYGRIPGGNQVISTLTYGQDLRRGTVEIVILVASMLLNTQEKNLQLVVTLVDSLASSLRLNAELLGMDSYTIRPDQGLVGGDTPHWAIIASLEVSGGD